MSLKENDRKNLESFLAFLETRGMRAELRGSAAAENPDYSDLDLNVWDAEEEGPGYKLGKLGRKAMDQFLKDLGIKEVHYSNPFPATGIAGRWQFNYKGTEFVIVYTPIGPSLQGYRLPEIPETKKTKKD